MLRNRILALCLLAALALPASADAVYVQAVNTFGLNATPAAVPYRKTYVSGYVAENGKVLVEDPRGAMDGVMRLWPGDVDISASDIQARASVTQPTPTTGANRMEIIARRVCWGHPCGPEGPIRVINHICYSAVSYSRTISLNLEIKSIEIGSEAEEQSRIAQSRDVVIDGKRQHVYDLEIRAADKGAPIVRLAVDPYIEKIGGPEWSAAHLQKAIVAALTPTSEGTWALRESFSFPPLRFEVAAKQHFELQTDDVTEVASLPLKIGDGAAFQGAPEGFFRGVFDFNGPADMVLPPRAKIRMADLRTPGRV